ncbi:MAG: polysaccharide deacetylase family protein [Pseudomonadota bacterium]
MGSMMWVSKPLRFLLAAFAFLWIGTSVAQACLGVSRTINVRSFQAHMGTGGSGGIGLRHKEVVLTFDDGPKRGTTPRILSALRAQCTKATFFVVGRMARANASLLQKVARVGHTIAQHTENHANLRNVSLASANRNIARGVASVRSALGPYRSRSSKLFRYPYLARSNALDGVLRRQGLLPFSAGILSNDWKRGSGAAMVNRVMAQLKRRGRGVILMHDIQSKTASALPLLLRRLKQGGYRVVHVRSGGSGGRSIGPVASSKKAKSSRHRVALFSRSTSNRSSLRTKRKAVSRATLSKRKTAKRAKRRTTKAGAPRTRLGKWLAKRRAASKKKSTTRKTRRRTSAYKAPVKKQDVQTAKKRGFSLFGKRMRRKEGESAKQYHARLRARRIRLNQQTSGYGAISN